MEFTRCFLGIALLVWGLGVSYCCAEDPNAVARGKQLYAEEPNLPLEWSIKSEKDSYYAGEPVLISINIKNSGKQQDEIDFGTEGIGAFSFQLSDLNNTVICKESKIERFGFSVKSPFAYVPIGSTYQKKIILNRWCSTLLQPGQYYVICNIDYRLRSEDIKVPPRMGSKAGPIHAKQLSFNFLIIPTDGEKFKEIIVNLANDALYNIKPGTKNIKELLLKAEIAAEMLTFTDNNMAIPYQLKLLEMEKYTWNKIDIINSLVKSNNVSAVEGLVQIVEDPNIEKDDIKPLLIEGVYKLRETGKAEIISATNDFVAKYKHPPVRQMPLD